LNVRTDRGRASIDERPCFKDSINLGEERFQITCPSLQELSDVGTRWRPGAPQVDDAVDLGEAESESLPLLDKGEQPQYGVGIEPIARCSPGGMIRSPNELDTDGASLLRQDGRTSWASFHGSRTADASSPWSSSAGSFSNS